MWNKPPPILHLESLYLWLERSLNIVSNHIIKTSIESYWFSLEIPLFRILRYLSVIKLWTLKVDYFKKFIWSTILKVQTFWSKRFHWFIALQKKKNSKFWRVKLQGKIIGFLPMSYLYELMTYWASYGILKIGI